MQTVQLAISDHTYANALCEALKRGGSWDVMPVESPDTGQDGVLVLDEDSLGRLQLPMKHPERVVLITRNDPRLLARAWEAGIISVLFHNASPNTVLLAIMSASLRNPRPRHEPAGRGISPTRDEPLEPLPSEHTQDNPK